MADEVTLPNTIDPPTVSTAEVQGNDEALRDKINGNIANGNISASAAIELSKLEGSPADELGLNAGGVVRRGKSIIATEEARTNTAYGTLTTPDQVANVVLPTDGVIWVMARARMKSSVSSAGFMGLFLGATQARGTNNTNNLEIQSGAADIYDLVHTTVSGITITASGSDVTTGQVVATGAIPFFAAAGTYTVSLQFRATSGSVTAKDRKLWVKAEGF